MTQKLVAILTIYLFGYTNEVSQITVKKNTTFASVDKIEQSLKKNLFWCFNSHTFVHAEGMFDTDVRFTTFEET
jgi:hypothetical protein